MINNCIEKMGIEGLKGGAGGGGGGGAFPTFEKHISLYTQQAQKLIMTIHFSCNSRNTCNVWP